MLVNFFNFLIKKTEEGSHMCPKSTGGGVGDLGVEGFC